MVFDKNDVVKEMEEKYPEMTTMYKEIMWDQYVTFCKKQNNYGPDNIALGKDLTNTTDRRFSLMGLFFRMNDKIQRLKQMILLDVKDEVGESEIDTFQDLSVYSIIAQLVTKGVWGK